MVIKTTLKKFLTNISKYIQPTQKPYLIAITGGSGSGKTYIANQILTKLTNNYQTILISQDDYIIDRDKYKSKNWDIPNSWDLKKFKQDLLKLKHNQPIIKHTYNFKIGKKENPKTLQPKEIIIIEGNYTLHNSIKNLINLKIFIHTDKKIRLQRRIKRDTKERGRTKEQILVKWNNYVQPMYEKYIQPQIKNADIIIKNN